MEVKGEISDTDSGIIIHSGPDSPTTNMKDVTTHTRAMKLKHQSLEDRLELCLLELKKLCIREAELTGCLSADYPLLPGEKPPQVRRRIGASFQLDEQSMPQGPEESELSSVDAKLALQLKIYEAACRLCRERHLDKAVKKSLAQQCKREERKVKQLQEEAFRLRLEHGRASPRPGFIAALQEQGISDDSSLSDSVVLDEDVASQSSQPSVGLHHYRGGRTDSPQPRPGSSQAPVDSSSRHSQTPPLTPNQTPLAPGQTPLTPGQTPQLGSEELRQSFNSSLEHEPPPIEHSPWTESSLDQPYQKSKKKSRSSSKRSSSSPARTEVLPPLEACLGHSPLPRDTLGHSPLQRDTLGHSPLQRDTLGHSPMQRDTLGHSPLPRDTLGHSPMQRDTLGHAPLQRDTPGHTHLKVCHTQSCSTPSTPEISVRRQLSLRASPVEPSFDPERHSRGRPRCPRRRLTDYAVVLPPEPVAPRSNYGSHANSETDSNSEHSYPSYNSSPCQEAPCDPTPKRCQPAFQPAFQRQHPSPTGGMGPLAPNQVFYQNPRHQSSPGFHRGYYEEDVGYYLLDMDMARGYYAQQTPPPSAPPPNRHHDYWYQEAPVQYQTAGPRPSPPTPTHGVRLSRTPSLWDHPHPHHNTTAKGLPRQVVNEELKSWHQRSQVTAAAPRRPRSLDRQGGIRLKHPPPCRESPLSQSHKYHEQVIQRRLLQRAAEDAPVRWFPEDTSEIISQV